VRRIRAAQEGPCVAGHLGSTEDHGSSHGEADLKVFLFIQTRTAAAVPTHKPQEFAYLHAHSKIPSLRMEDG
jgi:hypothetical protein